MQTKWRTNAEREGYVTIFIKDDRILDSIIETDSGRELNKGSDHRKGSVDEVDRMSQKSGKKIVFQRFPVQEGRRRLFPYPPLYREPDTDYICFTDDLRLHSSAWEIQMVEYPLQADLEPYLRAYDARVELQPNQIQMGGLFSASETEENVITVPALEQLPLVTFDPKKLEPTSDGEGNYACRRNPVYRDGKYNGRPLLLTIGVPVSNQIHTIDRCLSHIRPLLDQLDAELLVIDTGSTDGTVEVCRKYGARVITRPWCDNMSAVRNEGIYHAKGEWYLSIDDDEWFEDVEEILRFFQSGAYRNYDKASYIQRNYMDLAGTVYEDYHTLRMARITPGLHFEGRIHDSLMMEASFNKACLLYSYVHHYGFARDSEQKLMDKFMRNTAILLQDVYEYPYNLRYLFQLANEYRCIDRNDVAIKLFAEVIALAKEKNDEKPGKSSVVMLIACLYDTYDLRIFQWGKLLVPMFPLTVSERAFIAWCQEGMAFQYRQSPEQVLEYFHHYEENLKAYQKDPVAGQYLTYYGLATVEQDLYIMDAKAMAFCAYLETGEEGKALELLPQISMEVIRDRRPPMLKQGLAAGDGIYEAVCNEIAPMQWKEWADEILDAFVAGIAQDSGYRRQFNRVPHLLQRLGITSIISWFGHSEERNDSKVETRLYEYAMSREWEGASVQELCFCAWVLKDAYVRNRDSENGREILHRYLFAVALYAEGYYSRKLLDDAQCRAIPPDIRAAYGMAVALADGRASHENVMLLKQALEAFPAFHREIRSILMELGTKG